MVIPGGKTGLALVLWSLSACATPRPLSRQADPCTAVAFPAALLAPGRVLLFGEFHGTRELPAAFGELVCSAALSGPVVVGLELPRSEAERVAAYLEAPDPEARGRLLQSSPFWTATYQDGRASEAMAALLARLGALRTAGLPVEVFCFDQDGDHPAAGRDGRMAQAIAAAVKSRPAARALVLTGNLHARTSPGVPWDATFEPMGQLLRAEGLDAVGLDFAGPAGTAWTCTDADAAHCGTHALEPSAGGAPGVTRVAPPTPEGYSGRWSVPSLTASPPALADSRAGGRGIRAW